MPAAIEYLRCHVARRGLKPDQVDPHAWVYDIGENIDSKLLDIRTRPGVERIANIDDSPTPVTRCTSTSSPSYAADGNRIGP
jgi:hypothetical protein